MGNIQSKRPLASSSFQRKSKRSKTSLTKLVKRIVSGDEEIKYYDLATAAGTPQSLTANVLGVQRVTDVGQGLGDFQRVGSRTIPKYLQINFSLYQASAATNANIRVMVILDKSANSNGDPTITDVLEGANVMSPPNQENKDRFVFLKDQIIQVNGINSDTSLALQKWYISLGPVFNRLYKREHDKQISYLGTTSGATVTNARNAIYFCAVSDVGVTASMAVGSARGGMDYASRYAYSDA